jgi:DNA-binding GntR family transcriptional regulator
MQMKYKALEIIRQKIIRGTFPPDYYLQEVSIAKELGMSRTPIREALLVLEQEGFVSITPNKGALVTKLSVNEILDISEAREILEVAAIRRAIDKIDREVLEKIQAMFEDEIALCEIGLSKEPFEMGDQLHEAIFKAAGNKYIMKMYETLSLQFKRLISISRKIRQYERACREHLEIVNALIKGDVVQAEEVMREHIRGVTRDVLSWEDADTRGRRMTILARTG